VISPWILMIKRVVTSTYKEDSQTKLILSQAHKQDNNMKNKHVNVHFWGLGIGIILFIITGFTTSTLASTIQGGQFTINFDRNALAGAFTHNNDASRPSFYVEEHFGPAESAIRTGAQLLTDHIVPGTGEIPATGLLFGVNGSSVTNLSGRNHQPTNFSFDPADISGTASGSIGLEGAIRYRLNVPFTVSPSGEEEGNRVVSGDYTLEYDANRVSSMHSGWHLTNFYSFSSDTFDLDNVLVNLTGHSLSLSGDITLASGFGHLGGQPGSVVGDFSFQTTVVPIPAAIWLFGAGLAGLRIFRGRNNEL